MYTNARRKPLKTHKIRIKEKTGEKFQAGWIFGRLQTSGNIQIGKSKNNSQTKTHNNKDTQQNTHKHTQEQLTDKHTLRHFTDIFTDTLLDISLRHKWESFQFGPLPSISR